MKQFKRTLFIAIQSIILVSFILSLLSPLAKAEEAPQGILPVIEIAERQQNPSFLRQLRAEMNRLAQEDHARSEKDGVFKTVRRNFAPDSATFAIAGGLVYFERLKTVTGADPLLMVKHVESLKDPIAHISFGAFMVANGFYIDFRSKGLDPMTKMLAMQRLTYQGLAVGSIASSVTADVLGTLRDCTNGWISNTNDEAAHAACDRSWGAWSDRAKYVAYASQILSLLVTQRATEYFEYGAKKTFTNSLSKTAIKNLESKSLQLFKIGAANIDLLITGGGGVAVKSIRWLGKLTKFSMFLYVDHMISPHVTRVGNNLLQPLLFDFDALALNDLLYDASHAQWNQDKALKENQDCWFSKKCHSFEKLPKELKNFSERMSQWRMHLNAKAESDLSGWLEASSGLIHQIDYAKNFYKKYIENSFETLNRQYLVDQGEFADAPDRAWALERKFPYRQLPLFGVQSGHNYENTIENDMYVLKPYEVEKHQSEKVKAVASKYLAQIDKLDVHANSKKTLKEFVSPLTGTDINKQGEALLKIKQALTPQSHQAYTMYGTLGEQTNMYSTYSIGLKEHQFLAPLFRELGSPRPQFNEGAGYSLAFDSHTSNLKTAQAAKFDLSRRYYKFDKASDLMVYNMACGNQKFQVEEQIFSGLFIETPRLVTDKNLAQICSHWGTYITSESLYRLPIYVDGKKYQNITRYIVAKMNPKLLGDIKDSNTMGLGFNNWWASDVYPTIINKFKDLDQRYEKIVEFSYKQVLDQKGFLDFSIDLFTNGSEYLDKNIEDNFYFELEVYIKTLRSLLLQEKINSKIALKDFNKSSKVNRFSTAFSETTRLNQLKNNFKALNPLSTFKIESAKSLDDVENLFFMPLTEKVNQLDEKQKYTQILKTNLALLKKQLLSARIEQLEQRYKNLLALLRSAQLNFEVIEKTREELYSSNQKIFGLLKMLASTPSEKLPLEIQTLLAVSQGLESFEIDVNRFVSMKLQLSKRLEVDMTKLNQYVKSAQMAAPKVGATPHSSR